MATLKLAPLLCRQLFSTTSIFFLLLIGKLDEDPRFSSSEFKSFVKSLENDEKWASDYLNQGANAAQGTIICECHTEAGTLLL